jgi:hypothetical protein
MEQYLRGGSLDTMQLGEGLRALVRAKKLENFALVWR